MANQNYEDYEDDGYYGGYEGGGDYLYDDETGGYAGPYPRAGRGEDYSGDGYAGDPYAAQAYTDYDYAGLEAYPDLYPVEPYYDEPEQVPWFVFTFPSPGCITGITIAICIFLALFLVYSVGFNAPGVPAAEVVDVSVPPTPGVIYPLTTEQLAAQEAGAFEASPEAAAAPCDVSELFPNKVLRWCNLISYYAKNQNLSPDLVAALVWLESGGNEVAYSKSGAVGLMQVMPRDGLAASFQCVNGPCFSDRPSIAELENPEFNLKYGTKMLARLLNKHGNLRDALKSYGPMNVGYYYADKVLGLFGQYGKTP